MARPTPEQIASTKPCPAVLEGYERIDGNRGIPIHCTRPLGHAPFTVKGLTYTHSDQRNGNPIDWDESGTTIRYDHEPRPLRQIAASPKVVYTARQKREIRGHNPHYKMRFLKDGTVHAQKARGGAWGVLYTPEQARTHLKAKGLWRPVYELHAGRVVSIDGTPVFHINWAKLDRTQSYPIAPAQLDSLASHIVALLNADPQRLA